MNTVKLAIAYDGTDYRGWQVQASGKTIQGEIEKAIKKIFGKDHRLHGSSRTDSGVHAAGQVAHFKTSNMIPADKVPAALNSVLPKDIAILKAEYAEKEFHSRFDARSKQYRYRIFCSREKDPFNQRYVWCLSYWLDLSLMKKEAEVLIGRHDFKAFQASDKKERSSTRNILHLDIVKKGSFITINIEADGFLYNMVRNIVGTLVDIGRGHLPPGSMKKILDSRDRTQAGPTAPPEGLCLREVKY
ncbi:MAG: tRNA pseudouridine(38-40) synthase TruA [Candidatus Omnitrophica bacterium]|nr:tRNA pseudouridine(38-40) synthase TruA [Candidatus Omnitrophota bacterium]MBU1128329.1 tRNA pseudouridine(38-40) synthase TruA [Candidatus Omnitrophota bacterium]MBU1784577.1 tRNA pseudouridine(38-40) synthase TruA [Candidatus Omnitrophota bacterium]MBU1851753.1 tRNA pseudouridine(38-40) synthase TruA [Candidatus Omnitrophota bacterium]